MTQKRFYNWKRYLKTFVMLSLIIVGITAPCIVHAATDSPAKREEQQKPPLKDISAPEQEAEEKQARPPSSGDIEYRTLTDYRLVIEDRSLSEDESILIQYGNVLLFPLGVIAKNLNQTLEYDEAAKTLTYHRTQDNVSFQVDVETGEIKSKGKSLGYAPYLNVSRPTELYFPMKMVMAVTGTHFKADQEKNEIHIVLDERLKTLYDFILEVNGKIILNPEPEPRVIGAIILVPLVPIAEELGHEVDTSQLPEKVSVTRTYDNAKLTLELASGLVRYNDRPIGITPNMSYAFIDSLLLPHTAVETLTGTHIEIPPGTNRIVVQTEEELQDILKPRFNYLEEEKKTPFTPERFEFVVGDEVQNDFSFKSRYRQFNSEFNVRTPDFFLNNDMEPNWVDLKYRSIMNYGGSFGDYTATVSELSPVGVTRLRGASFYKVFEEGTLITAAGQPVSGARQIPDNYSIPEYDGFAAAARYVQKKREWETGLSFRKFPDSDSVAAIGTYERDHRFIFENNASFSLSEYIDVGYFDAENQSDDGFDIRSMISARYKPKRMFTFGGALDYIGINFNRSIEALNGDDDAYDMDKGKGKFSVKFEPIRRLSLGGAAAMTWEGIFNGRNDEKVKTYSATLSTNPFNKGPWLHFDYSHMIRTTDIYASGDEDAPNLGTTETDDRYNVLVSQRLGKYYAMARYRKTDDEPDDYIFQLSRAPFMHTIKDAGELTLNVGLSARKRSDHETVRPTGGLSFTSYPFFHERTLLDIDYTCSQVFDDEENEQNDFSQYLHAGLRFAITKTIELDVGFNTTFEGEETVVALVKGGIDFAAPRMLRKPQEGRGVIRANVYLDANHDGVRQEGEKGLPGVPVIVRMTRLKVRTNINGEVTIQNIPAGMYRVSVSLEKLPLEYMILEEPPMLRVDDGEFTFVDIPIILGGRISGRVFEDRNRNGVLDPDEPGVEQARLIVRPGDADVFTAVFGQFVIEKLKSGTYTIEVDPDHIANDLTPPEPIRVDIDAAENMEPVIVHIPVVPKDR